MIESLYSGAVDVINNMTNTYVLVARNAKKTELKAEGGC